MPLYSFSCSSCDSEQDEFFRFNDRPKEIECRKCNGSAKYVIRLSESQANDAGNEKTYNSEMKGLAMHGYKCRSCEHRFEEIVDRSCGELPGDSQTCPKCSSTDSRWIPSMRIDRWSERFPYYDRGLGVMLQSKAHRKAICKERGLTPVDGDWNVDAEFSKMDETTGKEIREYDEYCDKFDNSPEFRHVRKLRDQGRI